MKENLDEKEPATAKATAGNPPSTKNSSRNGRKVKYDKPDVRYHQPVEHANSGVQYCQPTSSKTKVEDLVTSKEEEEPLRKEQATYAGFRSFRDRPIPKQQFEWPFDPRMPPEWNKVIAAMREYEGARSHQTQGPYRNATDDEISEPEDFQGLGNMDNMSMDQVKAQTVTRLRPGKEDWDLRKLRTKFEKPQSIATKLNAPEGPVKPSVDKGKQKDTTEPPPPDKYTHLREHWRNDYANIMDGVQEALPLWREVNHKIHLIDESKRYHYHLPRCPNSLRDEFYAKVNRYVNAGWWELKSVPQAAPMLCVRKKDNRLRTVIDARQRNENTVKDVTPLPDQEVIREDMARGKI